MTQTTVVVVAGGDAPHPGAVAGLPPGARVIAADSGLEHALALGLDVDLVVGDMDSVDPARLDAAAAAGTVVEQHPVAKDQTDMELALERALDQLPAGPSPRGRLVVLGSDGGRLDHLLSVALLLASPAYAAATVEAWLGPAALQVVRDEATVHGQPGDLVTLLPVHGPALGVATDGLLYPLVGEDLPEGTSRGVSNELLRTEATVAVREGVLLVVRPLALA